MKRARTPVWALKALIELANVKVKVGRPGTIVDYLGVIRIPRVSGLVGLVSVNFWLAQH